LENLNYNPNNDDEKRVIKIKPTLSDYKKASCAPLLVGLQFFPERANHFE
jgi:hypothetical protein